MKHIIALIPLLLSFYLGVYNENLAIWDTETKKPVFILPYKMKNYPEADQQKLREGIPFETPDELSALLEDYMS